MVTPLDLSGLDRRGAEHIRTIAFQQTQAKNRSHPGQTSPHFSLFHHSPTTIPKT
jgi:hypothetical protein